MEREKVKLNRRDFIRAASALAVLPTIGGCVGSRSAEGAGGRPLLGVCCGSFDDVRLVRDTGFDFWETTVSFALDPTKDGDWWKRRRDELLAQPIPLRACNGFIPWQYRLTGPEADQGPALAYGETALRRAEEAGVRAIVFGSGGARNVPGDFSGPREKWPDTLKGTRQYADFCRELCRRVADLKTVQVVIEPLSPAESNIVNYVWQGRQICEDVHSPRLGVLADFYHMHAGRDEVSTIVSSRDFLGHCHVAEPETRSFPGSDPARTPLLKPYFDALKAIGYAGGISCECGWGDVKDREKNLALAHKTLQSLI